MLFALVFVVSFRYEIFQVESFLETICNAGNALFVVTVIKITNNEIMSFVWALMLMQYRKVIE